MTIYSAGDVVVVPFPFVESTHAKPSPALVLSSSLFNNQNCHSVLGMITTGIKTQWHDDVHIHDWKSRGLTASSVVRMKLFTLDNQLIKGKIGQLPDEEKASVQALLQHIFFS